MCFLIPPIPGKSNSESIRSKHFIANCILRFVQIFAHKHTYDFYQEVQYLKIFEYHINRYERTKEYLTANHIFDKKSIVILR